MYSSCQLYYRTLQNYNPYVYNGSMYKGHLSAVASAPLEKGEKVGLESTPRATVILISTGTEYE